MLAVSTIVLPAQVACGRCAIVRRRIYGILGEYGLLGPAVDATMPRCSVHFFVEWVRPQGSNASGT